MSIIGQIVLAIVILFTVYSCVKGVNKADNQRCYERTHSEECWK